MTQYSELKQWVISESHRADQSSNMDLFKSLAESRISKVLRVPEMVVYATTTPTENPFLLPADFLVPREVSRASTNGAGRVKMQSVNQAQLDDLSFATQGSAYYYTINGLYLEAQPSPVDTELRLIYYARPASLMNDDDTNPVLDAYPEIYLYAMLAELYLLIQDTERATAAIEVFNSEVESANEYAKWREAGEMMQSRGASQWV